MITYNWKAEFNQKEKARIEVCQTVNSTLSNSLDFDQLSDLVLIAEMANALSRYEVILNEMEESMTVNIYQTHSIETVDTEVYHRLLNRSWFVRVVSSNAVSIPLDSLLFAGIAFVGLLPNFVVVKIIYTEIIIKYVVGLVVAIRRRNDE